MKTTRIFASWLALIGLTAWLPVANAQTSNVVQDSFTGASATINWIPSHGACLTAGSGTGTVPACNGLAYYGSQTQAGLTGNVDPVGSGALRLTNGCAGGSGGTCYGNQSGAIISNTPFSSSQGIQVTFTTYAYSGNRGGGAGDGADGIGFYLLDASKVASTTSGGTTTYAPQIGAFGGSLGYSCSNTNNPHDGMVGAYLGLGMDEFGNFLNGAYQSGYTGDNTATGQMATNSNGGNGQQYQPQRIGLRGYGNVYLSELQALNPNATENDVKNTCENGGTYSYTTTGPTQYTFAYTYQPNGYYTTLVSTTYTYTPTNPNSNNNTKACAGAQPANTTIGGAGSTNGTAIAIAGGTPLYQQTSVVAPSVNTSGQVSVTYSNGKTYTCNTQTSVTTTTYTYSQPSSSATPSVPSATVGGTSTTNDDGYYGTSGPPFVLVNGKYYPVTESTSSNTPTNTNTATFPDYAAIPNAYVNLPSTTPIANESALTRSAATPIAYKLQITQTGLLSLWYSYNGGSYVPVLTSQSIASTNGAMPANFLFGFGGSTGGSENVHEITCFQATPADVSASSAGINVQQTGEVQTGTQVYLAYYHPNNWWGELDSQNLVYNSSTGTVSIASIANWDASCVLTGGSCAATGATSMTAQTSRSMVTWTGGPNDNASSPGAAPFNWGRLTTNEQAWLGANDSVANAGQVAQDRVNYLGGDRTNEVTVSGSSVANAAGSYDNFRARNSVLGDIIDSSPTWVGPPVTPYPNTWSDLLYPSATMPENATSATTYGTFASNEASRLNVVYVGANDGFMHGFETGYYKSDGTYACAPSNGTNLCADGTYNDGHEVLAYIPGAVLATIHNAATSTLDYSSVNYAHNFFVDATPGTGDLFYNNGWHTWLVSGLGTGGNAIFALDITDLGSGGASPWGTGSVKGEWSTAVTTTPASGSTPASTTVATTLACANDTSTSLCGDDLGQTVGTPQIRRLHNGQWAIIFGNGFNSVTGHAGIYVMTINNGNINASSSATSGVYFLDTGVGSTSNPNGIGYISAVDLDGDHITDYVYAGDAYGNVWRFDLTSSTPASWSVSNFGNSSPTPLFTTPAIKTVYTTTTTTSGGTTTTTTSSPTITILGPVSVSQQSTYGYGTTSTTSGNTTTYTVISPQPITTQLVVVSTLEPSSSSSTPYVLVEFGTGSTTPQSVSSGAVYSAGPQTLYGIWDWDLGVAGTAGSSYAGLVGASGAPTASTPITQSSLQQQTVTSTTTASGSTAILGYRTISENTVCLVGTTCTTVNSSGTTVSAAGTSYGWYLSLPGFTGVPWVGASNQTEQVIYSPIESEGAFIVNTTIPANNSPLTCSVNTAAGWTMALNPATGGGFTNSFFFDTTGNVISGSISGIALNAVGSPSVVTANGHPYLVNQTITGTGTVNQINPPGGQSGQRLTWLQLH
ncbi:hypothetical protein GCM10007862_19290 [Dyella lipolytica]|uniref:Pilus assembly protein PilY n=1 Tax=Dyella lipolytica TaxID=1867835 RepID=A0ABW8ISD2_9GAMM|nr:PilC/PilY family type IV pilus protein [Dyella lipolytica]GLQ46878.1 hypothetical protein GCM10007862_19290 [Dyella lipolytica]